MQAVNTDDSRWEDTNQGGQFIDAYNQSVGEVSGTIRRTYDSSNMHFVTEVAPPKKRKR